MLACLLTNLVFYVMFLLSLRESKVISTVTVTTVTTISTITTISAFGMVAVLSIAAIITLIAFLATKELVSARADGSSQRIGRFLNVGITPLLMVFAVVVILAVIEIVIV